MSFTSKPTSSKSSTAKSHLKLIWKNATEPRRGHTSTPKPERLSSAPVKPNRVDESAETSSTALAPKKEVKVSNYNPLAEAKKNCARVEKLWLILVVSLVLDFGLLAFYTTLSEIARLRLNAGPFPVVLDYAMLHLLVICLFSFSRKLTLEFIRGFGVLRLRLLQFANKRRWYFIAALGLVTMLEIAIPLVNLGYMAALAGVVIAAIAFAISLRALLKSQRDAIKKSSDKVLVLKQKNLELFLSSLLPLVSIRTFALIGTLRAGLRPDPIFDFLPLELAAFLMLVALRPFSDHFLMRCVRCAEKAAIAEVDDHGCTRCNAEKLVTKVFKEPEACPSQQQDPHSPRPKSVHTLT